MMRIDEAGKYVTARGVDDKLRVFFLEFFFFTHVFDDVVFDIKTRAVKHVIRIVCSDDGLCVFYPYRRHIPALLSA
jgi:hypothetical protein